MGSWVGRVGGWNSERIDGRREGEKYKGWNREKRWRGVRKGGKEE